MFTFYEMRQKFGQNANFSVYIVDNENRLFSKEMLFENWWRKGHKGILRMKILD